MGEHTPAPTPGRAVYGFALFLLFNTLFLIYIIWAFVPTKILEDTMGLFYLPDKYFALYIPILILCGVTFFAFFIYPSMNLAMTADDDDVTTIRDKFSIFRCKFVDSDGLRCENKVITKPEEGWHVPKYCSIHEISSNDGQEQCKGEELISNLCDCPEGRHCMLRENLDHLNILRKRTKVPTVSDLDLDEMCSEVFGGCETG